MNYVDHLTDQNQTVHTLIDVGGRASIAPTESTSTSSKAYAVGELFYYEGVLYKVITAIAQGDSIVTSGSGQNVEVDTVSDELGEIQNQIDVVRDNGAVNYLPYPYDSTSGVTNGVTITDLGNGKLKVGDASAQTATGGIVFDLKVSFKLPTGNYKITGCPSGGGDSTYMLRIWLNDVLTGSDNGNGFTANIRDSDTIRAFFYIRSGATIPAGGIVVMPMISDARLNLSYADYLPHALTNPVLTQKVAGLQKTGCINVLSNDATSQVVSGVTVVKNANESLSISTDANGATADVNITLHIVTADEYAKLANKEWKLVGCPIGGSFSTYYLTFARYNADGTGAYDVGSGATFTFTRPVTSTAPYVALTIRAGTVLTTPIVVKPMLTPDLSATYDDYQPHSMTNRELTEAVTVEDITSKLNIYTDNFTIYALSAQRCGHIHNINFQLVAVNAGSADAGIDAIAFDDSVMPDSNTTLIQGWHMSSQSKYKGIFNVLRRTGRIAVVPSVAVSVGDYFNCSFMYMKK